MSISVQTAMSSPTPGVVYNTRAFALKLYASGAKPERAPATVTVVTDRGAYEAPLTLQ